MHRLIFLITSALVLSISGLYASETSGRTTILKHEDETILLIDAHPEEETPLRIEIELSGTGIMTMSDSTETVKLRFSAGGDKNLISIYEGTAGIFPEKISIAGGDFDLFSAAVVGNSDMREPIPADIGHIIFSDFNSGRNPDWEIYRWNLIPEVLIFDTADYAVQARLFKRLAFYVEKPGFVGTLVSNENLEGRHGWNAHDYKPDDLAAFFSKAEDEGFSLNPEELLLRSALTDSGIIIENAGEYLPGHGAVLSVSRETTANWRYRFLTHECIHGIFFTNDSYRKDIEAVFNNLDSDEVEFWKHLLDYRQYDVSNTYLLINEFMAYSLQQPAAEADDYFKGFLYRKMIAARPWEKEFVDDFERTHPDSFRNTVAELSKILASYTGRQAGHLANLYPAALSESFFDLFPPVE